MKKIISFSLWGNNFRYLGGSLQNVELAKYFYPDWKCRFYIGSSTRKDFVEKLRSFDNVEVIEMNEEGDWRGMFWRFLPASDETVEIMLSRDCDSRIHRREVDAVNNWLTTDKDFHIMRDHKFHGTPILGGMWGVRNGLLKDMEHLCSVYESGDFWQTDQNFLRDVIFDKIINSAYVHDEFHWIGIAPNHYPVQSGVRDPNHFVGQAYDGDGKVLDQDIYFNDYLRQKEGFEIKVHDEFK